METMKAGDKIYVEQCPRDNGSCDYSGEFERVADGSYWFACPKCGWEITDEDEPLKPEEKMNRIIKFRGKRLDNGEWVYGYVVFYKNIGAQIHRDEDIEVWVDPNSVGQFTGLTDKNGKEIFEGDILRSVHFKDIEKTNYLYHVVEWTDDLTGWLARNISNEILTDADKRVLNGDLLLWVYMKNTDFEVIGNIHDNKDLVK